MTTAALVDCRQCGRAVEHQPIPEDWRHCPCVIAESSGSVICDLCDCPCHGVDQ